MGWKFWESLKSEAAERSLEQLQSREAGSVVEASSSAGAQTDRAGSFSLVVDGVSTTGRSTVATGVIESGTARVGMHLTIIDLHAGPVTCRLSGIEVARRSVEQAGVGQHVGLVLHRVRRQRVSCGALVTGRE